MIQLRTFVLIFSLVQFAAGERLPVRVYNTVDGLAHDRVNCIVQSSRGFLWFCTDEGLTRFDGVRFKSYKRADGLPHAHVNSFLEARSGTYWIATDGGLCRFDPKPRQQGAARRCVFTTYRLPGGERSQEVNSLAEDRDGGIWCATSEGLFRADVRGAEPGFELTNPPFTYQGRDRAHVTQVRIDKENRVWASTVRSGLFRRDAPGAWRQLSTDNGLTHEHVDGLYEDPLGAGFWVGLRVGGAYWLAASSEAPWFRMRASLAGPVLGNEVRDFLRTSDGRLWFAGNGLTTSSFGAPGSAETKPEVRAFSTAQGLSDHLILRLAEDRERNFWLGTYHAGVIRIPREGFVSFGPDDGFRQGGQQSIFETPAGDVCLWSGTQTERDLLRFDGARFKSVRVNLPARRPPVGVSSRQTVLLDKSGVWWIPTEFGIFRFPSSGPAGLPSASRDRSVEGLDRLGTQHLFEDSAGDVWIAAKQQLLRWRRATGKLERFTPRDLGLTALEVGAFAEPVRGVVWIGQRYEYPLLRWRDGRVEVLSGNGAPVGRVNHLWPDHLGRLWIATAAGLVRVDSPAAEQPRYQAFTTTEGLSSNDVYTITEDRLNRIYVGTGAGVDRLTGDPPRIQHFSTEHGLSRGRIEDALFDRKGNLWFVTSLGVSRFTPGPATVSPAPEVFLSAFHAGGTALPVSELGESRLGPFELAPGQNHVEIEFGSIDLRPRAPVRFQTRFYEDSPWSPPMSERTVNLAGAAPGRYRFQVRAINEFGESSGPAIAEFVILAPFWRRWWFLALCAAGLAAAGYAAHLAKLRHILALAAMRERISADLHDDIGSSLSRVVILSELAESHIGSRPGDVARSLAQIASTGRNLLDNMSDIIWSIDPGRDGLSDLTARIGQYAGEALDPAGIRWKFEGGADALPRVLSPEQRRHVYLIFKEAIYNAARHAHCTSVTLRLRHDGESLSGEIADDGLGVQQKSPDGNGLANMRARAAELGGHLEINSAPGLGTRVRFRVSARRRS